MLGSSRVTAYKSRLQGQIIEVSVWWTPPAFIFVRICPKPISLLWLTPQASDYNNDIAIKEPESLLMPWIARERNVIV
jgi:hypothetical protein